MGSKRNQRRTPSMKLASPAVAKWGWLQWSLPFAVGAVLAGFVVFALMQEQSSLATSPGTNSRSESRLPSLGDLALMPSEELAGCDLALLNLRCAEGLPGAESLDVKKCLATLDLWAEKVRFDTDRYLYKFRQNPGEFQNSSAVYRMMMLVTVLQQDFNVHYNKQRIDEIDFTKSRDLFLHGMVGSNGPESNGGTCISMPVLYTAVARRLGYPVYLVAAKAHVFCRWDSPKDRFNIEATNQGMNSFDDKYYMTWPKPISEADVDRGLYLKSLSMSESFAMFLAARGHCLEDNRFGAKARVAYAMAHEKSPQHPLYFGFLAQTMRPPTSLASDPPLYRPSPFRDSIPGPSIDHWTPPSDATAVNSQQLHDVFKAPASFSANLFPQEPTSVSNQMGFRQHP